MKETFLPILVWILLATVAGLVILNVLSLWIPGLVWFSLELDNLFAIANLFLMVGILISRYFIDRRFNQIASFFESQYTGVFKEKNSIKDPLALSFLETEVGKFITYHKGRVDSAKAKMEKTKYVNRSFLILVGFSILAFFDLGFTWFVNSLATGAPLFVWYVPVSSFVFSLTGLLFLTMISNAGDLRDVYDWGSNLYTQFRTKRIQEGQNPQTVRDELMAYYGVNDISKINHLIDEV